MKERMVFGSSYKYPNLSLALHCMCLAMNLVPFHKLHGLVFVLFLHHHPICSIRFS